MSYQLYNTALAFAAPIAHHWLNRNHHQSALTARFNPKCNLPNESPLWVQACSVGEVNTAYPLLQALHKHYPQTSLLLTASTTTGHQLAQQRHTAGPVTYFPVDTRHAVRQFLTEVRPKALILIETELWPNILRETSRANIPTILVNGRLSNKHYTRYRRFKHILPPMFQFLTAAGMQHTTYAQRLQTLGVHPDRIHITGNLKFDALNTPPDPKKEDDRRLENGLPKYYPTIIFGSARTDDLKIASACWSHLRDEVPNLRLILAPRHTHNLEDDLKSFSEPLLRRSQVLKGRRPNNERIFLLDTHGELLDFYALATLAIVGGSLYPGVSGHNPLEPAALGVPTIFGPHMSNFLEPAQVLLEAKGAQQIQCPEDLYGALSDLLANPEKRNALATNGRNAVLENQGATEKTIALITKILENLETPLTQSTHPVS